MAATCATNTAPGAADTVHMVVIMRILHVAARSTQWKLTTQILMKTLLSISYVNTFVLKSPAYRNACRGKYLAIVD